MSSAVISNPIIWCIVLLAGAIYFTLIREALLARGGQVPIAGCSWVQVSGALVAMLPLLGLLGTIAGLLQAFHELSLGTGTNPGERLAGGIAAALYTTEWGLLTAIPAWFLRQWIDHRLQQDAPT